MRPFTPFLGMALAVSLVAAGSANAADHFVPGDFTTIQEALDSATVVDGDTIFVTTDGTHASFTVGKSVTIENASAGVVTISGGGNGVVVNNDSSPTLVGLDISGNPANGIAVESNGTVTIRNSTLTNNGTGGNDSAIQVTAAVSPTIVIEDSSLNSNPRRAFTSDFAGAGGQIIATNTTFNNNGETGIFLGAPAGSPIAMDIQMTDCQINDNGTGGFGRGAQFFGGSLTMVGGSVTGNNNNGLFPDGPFGNVTMHLTGVEITNNGEQGVALLTQGNYTFVDCDISNNTFQGIFRLANAGATPTVLEVIGTTISSNGTEGIFLEDQAVDATITDTSFIGNANGGDSQLRAIGGQTINIDVEGSFFDWNNSGGNLVLVAPGTYNIRNTVINGGGGGVGSILAENGGTFVLEHVTIASAPGASGAGVFSGGGADTSFTLRNVIFSGVATAIVNNRETNNWDVDYCLFDPDGADIGGSFPAEVGGIGANSISGLAAGFVQDTTGFGSGDFRLTAGSPALSAGQDLSIEEDKDGAARPNPVGSPPDMGAYEAGPVTSLSAALVNFPPVAIDTVSSASVNILNDGIEDVTVTGLDVVGPDAGVYTIVSPATVPFVVEHGDLVTVSLTFESASAGSFTSATLQVATTDAVADVLEANLTAEAFEGPAIGAAPTSLAFGSITVATSTTLQVDVSNVGDQPLEITGLDLTGSDAGSYTLVSPPSVPLNINPGDPAVVLTVRFAPAEGGDFNNAALEVSSSNATNSPLSVPLSGTATTPPELVLSDTSLDFGAIDEGDATDLDLTIDNEGDEPLVISSLQIVGNDAGNFALVDAPTLPATIPGGEDLVLKVEFSPAEAGIFDDATLEIGSNDPVNPTVFVTLEGEGIEVTRIGEWMMLID